MAKKCRSKTNIRDQNASQLNFQPFVVQPCHMKQEYRDIPDAIAPCVLMQ